MGLQIEKLDATAEVTPGESAENADHPPVTEPEAPLSTGEPPPKTGGTPAVEAPPADPATKVEAKPTEPAKPKVPTEEELSKSWTKFREEQQAFWRAKKAFDDEQAKTKAAPTFTSAADIAKFLEENANGITFDQVLDHYVPDEKKTAGQDDPRWQKLEALEREVEAKKEAEAKASQQKVWDDGVAAVAAEVKAINGAEAGALQLLEATGAHDRVLVKMHEFHRDHGQPKDWREAASEVEAELREQWTPVLDALVALPIFASRYAKVQSDDKPKSKPRTKNGASATPRDTLTNDDTVSVSGGDEPLPLDPDARDAAILRRIRQRA